jgi:sugar phosphate isomerase/epimerase
MNTLSLSTWIYDRLPFEEAAKRVKKSGYNSIELSGWNWVDGIWTVEEVASVCEKEKIKVLSVHCNHHSLYNKDYWSIDRYEEYHSNLYKSLRIFGNVIIVEHGLLIDSIYANDALNHLKLLKDLSKKYNHTLTFENVPGTIYQHPKEMDSIFDDTLKFTFDVAHSAYIDIDPLAFERHFKHMVNAHVYDVVNGVHLGDWAPVGTGKIDWSRYMNALKKASYKGPFTIELNEDNFVRVLEIYGKVVSSDVILDVADQCAIYAREQIEKLL